MNTDLERQISMDSLKENYNSFQPETTKKTTFGEFETELQQPITKVTTCSSDDDNDDVSSHIYLGRLGREKYRKSELFQAFEGSLHPGWAAPSAYKFGNPAPLGLSAFALTTFVLSLVNAGAMGVENDSVVVGLALCYGGFIQLLAGMWCMAVENTFAALALSSYGGFWMSFACISIPWFNIADSYDDPIELDHAVGFYLLGWTIFTFMMILCTMKSTVAFCGLFVSLDVTFLLLALGKLAQSPNCTVSGGIFGLITSFIGWYNAYAGLADIHNSYFTVKPWQLPR